MAEEQITREADLAHLDEQDFFDSWAAYRKLVIKQLEYLEAELKANKEKLEEYKDEFDELNVSYTELKTKINASIWVGGTLISLLITYLGTYFNKLFGAGK